MVDVQRPELVVRGIAVLVSDVEAQVSGSKGKSRGIICAMTASGRLMCGPGGRAIVQSTCSRVRLPLTSWNGRSSRRFVRGPAGYSITLSSCRTNPETADARYTCRRQPDVSPASRHRLRSHAMRLVFVRRFFVDDGVGGCFIHGWPPCRSARCTVLPHGIEEMVSGAGTVGTLTIVS